MIMLVLLLLPAKMLTAKTATSYINTSQLQNGVVAVNYQPSQDQKVKVMVTKGSEKYTYDLNKNGKYPLQLGIGAYTVQVLENTSGNQYKVIETTQVDYKTTDPKAVYTQSIDMINWNQNMKAIQKAKALTANLKTDKEKAAAIYDFVVNHVRYDNNKAIMVEAGYIPSVDQVFDSALGICFDYSVLYGAMMRSIGIPTKMNMGYTTHIKEYHAWNEVYLKETNEWVIIDTTFDAPSVQQGVKMQMVKNASDYQIEKQY